ncbi:PREDICTED: 5'-3' exoribonuclease 2-like [Priapulus caudatus]|uniref:5'-3' exoribonuclease 2-like n=1 Tax=Priapulus caudatus TaxID=37621 RepID=A0ABM1EYU8_PRICU|nr:PREDICTED: 5'-3' exoribonuclease 2-like [Priapulus caudatus]XP_014677369.1 PREDICTED: 5'-3' exoribonuclease 2-like [Priapulus caudatus]
MAMSPAIVIAVMALCLGVASGKSSYRTNFSPLNRYHPARGSPFNHNQGSVLFPNVNSANTERCFVAGGRGNGGYGGGGNGGYGGGGHGGYGGGGNGGYGGGRGGYGGGGHGGYGRGGHGGGYGNTQLGPLNRYHSVKNSPYNYNPGSIFLPTLTSANTRLRIIYDAHGQATYVYCVTGT